MNRNIRSVGIFAVVAVILAAIVVGGVRFAKNRDAIYAAQHKAQAQHDTAQANTGTTKNPPAPSSSPNPQPTKQDQKTTPAPQPQPAPKDAQKTQPQPSPVAVAPSPTPSPTPQPTSSTGSAPAPSSAQKVPSTGPTDEFFITAGLIMAAIYLGIFIHKNRLTYKRLLS